MHNTGSQSVQNAKIFYGLSYSLDVWDISLGILFGSLCIKCMCIFLLYLPNHYFDIFVLDSNSSGPPQNIRHWMKFVIVVLSCSQRRYTAQINIFFQFFVSYFYQIMSYISYVFVFEMWNTYSCLN